MKILIVGHLGQVGVELQRSLAPLGELALADKESVELAQPSSVRELLRSCRPDIIVNAAAYTAVDRAESEPELAHAINGLAPGVLAEEAARLGALLIHYSTDYVFDGSKQSPWLESDAPNPINVYGESKLAGERAVAAAGGRHYIFRTSWVYAPHGSNFVRTIVRLAGERDELRIVDDQIGAPTSAGAIAKGTARAIVANMDLESGAERAAHPEYGIYHLTCRGETSWFGFAREALSCVAAKVPDKKLARCVPIPSSQYTQPARRPRNSVLSNQKLLRGFGFQLPEWRTAMELVIEQGLAQDFLAIR